VAMVAVPTAAMAVPMVVAAEVPTAAPVAPTVVAVEVPTAELAAMVAPMVVTAAETPADPAVVTMKVPATVETTEALVVAGSAAPSEEIETTVCFAYGRTDHSFNLSNQRQRTQHAICSL